jgi:hypothetical protein
LWERYNGARGIEPIPELWDACLSDIAVAQVLNLPATSIPDIPPEYVIAAVLKMQAEAKHREQQSKEERHQAARKRR